MNRRAFIVFAAVMAASPAAAHRARSGSQYLPGCCNANDCEAVEDRFVHELGGGRVVMRIEPGSHPMWGADRKAALVMEYGPEHRRDPLDGEWHACFGAHQNPLCYHPPNRGM